MSEQELTREEIEHKERKARKSLKLLAEGIRVSYKSLKELALKTAKEFEEAGTIKTKYICLEILKGLEVEISNGLVESNTVRAWLPDKYKLPTGPKSGIHRNESQKDLPALEVELLERVAGVDFQKIRDLDVKNFVLVCRDEYMREITARMSDDEVHYQSLILNYLYPMVRDMLEVTETRRSEMKKKSDMLSP